MFINLFKKIIFKIFKFIMKYFLIIVFFMYKWYKFMKNICIFEYILIEKKSDWLECFKKLKYYLIIVLYFEKLIRIKWLINE